MNSPPARALVLYGVPALAIGAVLVTAPWRYGWLALAVFVAAGLLEAFPARFQSEVEVTLHAVANMVGLLLGGPAVAVAGALGAGVGAYVTLPKDVSQRLQKGLFNSGMFVLATYVSAMVFVLVNGATTGPVDGIGVGVWLPALALADLTHLLVNLSLLALVVAAVEGRPIGATFSGLFSSMWWSQPFSLVFAVLAFVVVVEAGVFALVLLAIPLVAARQSMLGVVAQRDALDRVVRSLVRLVEVKDGYTRGHAERVADLSDKVAQRLGIDAEERYWIRIGAVLHDVGKIAVPLGVLCKAGPLDDHELTQMRRHPDLGADLLEDVEDLAPAVPLVRMHHERLDGRGYPRGIGGDDLPLATRIVSAVDAWDAMTTTRPYRNALSDDIAIAELRANAGTQFDPRVVEALIAEVAPDAVRVPARAGARVARTAEAGA